MKGSKKLFARYLQSEYNDEYLQPLDDDEDDLDRFARISEQLEKYTADPTNTTKSANEDLLSRSKEKTSKPNQESNGDAREKLNGELKIDQIKELANKLSQDIQDCASNLIDIEHVQSLYALKGFRSLYKNFETIPILFLSLVPNKAVYVWQINRLCPVTRESKDKDSKKRVLIVDSKNIRDEVGMHISFLLLGKITPKEGEELLGAQFVGDQRLCVRLKTGDNELLMRFYHFEDFAKQATVNPFQDEVWVTNLHYSKVLMRGIKGEDTTSENLEVSVWRKGENGESKITLVKTSNYKNFPGSFVVNENTFAEICLGLNTNAIVMLDEATSTIVAYRDNDICCLSCNIFFYNFMTQVEDSLIVKKGDEYQRINFEAFPEILVENLGSNLEGKMQNDIEKSKDQKFWKYQQKVRIMTQTNNYINCQINVYHNKINVRNPYQPESLTKQEPKRGVKVEIEQRKQEEEVEEEKEKETLDQRIDKMKKEFEGAGNGRSEIKDKKELLREIRADIGKGMREVAIYEENCRQYERQSPWYSEYQKKELVEPSGVSKESLELYGKIKEEKRILDKKREKEKNQMKRDRDRDRSI